MCLLVKQEAGLTSCYCLLRRVVGGICVLMVKSWKFHFAAQMWVLGERGQPCPLLPAGMATMFAVLQDPRCENKPALLGLLIL